MGRPRGARAERVGGRVGAARRTATAAVGVAVASGMLSGCLGSGFTFVNHRSPDGTNLYFKVPSDWTVFNNKQILEARNGRLGPAQVKELSQGQWIEELNASPTPRPSGSLPLGSRFPTGVVSANLLSPLDRDQLSFSSMRSAILGVDPLTATSGFRVLSYTEFTRPGGVRGARLVTDIDPKGRAKTFAQIVAVDGRTNWLFLIGVGCRVSCWASNSGTIRQVLDSWTLKESKS
jgi:hypothetical protein